MDEYVSTLFAISFACWIGFLIGFSVEKVTEYFDPPNPFL